jgi:hypothetical protein
MNSTVLFLGAGASVEFGLPLTRDISRLVVDGLDDQTLFERAWYVDNRSALRQQLIGYLRQRHRVGTGKSAAVPSIAELLLDAERRIARAAPTHREDAKSDRDALRRAVLDVLDIDNREIQNEDALRCLATWVAYGDNDDDDLTVVTTNYDTLLEDALYQRLRGDGWYLEEAIDYGCTWTRVTDGRDIKRPDDPWVHFYKLHGSLNWALCPVRRCGALYINRLERIYHVTYGSEPTDATRCSCKHPRNWPLRLACITPSRDQRPQNQSWKSIWRHATTKLSRAQRWVIVGYSFPKEDEAIKEMFRDALERHRIKDSKPAIDIVTYIPKRDPGAQAEEARLAWIFPGVPVQVHRGGFLSYIPSLCAGSRVRRYP